MINRIWELLHDKNTIVFFDIDGTLTSYNYGASIFLTNEQEKLRISGSNTNHGK